MPFRAYGAARVVGDALYVSVDSGTGWIDTLLRYDLGTGASCVVLKVPTDIAWVTVNERWLLWESEKTLYSQPVGGGPRRVLAAGREMFAPALEGDIAGWVDYEEGSEGRVMTFNLKTGEEREIARTHLAGFYNNFIQIRDAKVLWTDIFDGTGHYVVHDLATARTRDYPMPKTRFRYPGYALRSGDSVYSINFDRYDEWDWGTQQVGRFSLSTGAFTPISEGDTYVNSLVVGRDAVAVIDSSQRLWVGLADAGYPTKDLSAKLSGSADLVQVSSDGVTAVAGHSLADRGETTLYVFPLR